MQKNPGHDQGDELCCVAAADAAFFSSFAVKMLRAMAEVAPTIMGRPLPINVSGAIPAVMLDAGYPLGAMKGTQPDWSPDGDYGSLANLYDLAWNPTRISELVEARSPRSRCA